MRELSTDSPRRWQILRTLERGLDVLDLADVAGSAPAVREVLAPALAAPAHAGAHRVSAVGHAHIDSAWLWPLRETVRKVARNKHTLYRASEGVGVVLHEPQRAGELVNAAVNLIWNPVPFVDLGVEYMYGHRLTVGNQRGDQNVLLSRFRVQF